MFLLFEEKLHWLGGWVNKGKGKTIPAEKVWRTPVLLTDMFSSEKPMSPANIPSNGMP